MPSSHSKPAYESRSHTRYERVFSEKAQVRPARGLAIGLRGMDKQSEFEQIREALDKLRDAPNLWAGEQDAELALRMIDELVLIVDRFVEVVSTRSW
jgi:hypothetical protein